MHPTGQDNLSSLANSAHQQIARQSAHTVNAVPRSPVFHYLGVAALWLAVVSPLVFNVGGIQSLVFGPSANTARTEALITLGAARRAVESHRSSTGQMPTRVPLVALDALVQLEETATGYRLTTRSGKVSMQMDEKGQWTED